MFDLFWTHYTLEILLQGLILLILISYIGTKSKMKWNASKIQFIVIATFAMFFSFISLFVIADVLAMILSDVTASDGRLPARILESGTIDFIPYLVWQGITFIVMFSFLGIIGYNSIDRTK